MTPIWLSSNEVNNDRIGVRSIHPALLRRLSNAKPNLPCSLLIDDRRFFQIIEMKILAINSLTLKRDSREAEKRKE